MSSDHPTDGRSTLEQVITPLTVRLNRQILAFLQNRESSVAIPVLAANLSTRRSGRPTTAHEPADRRSTRLRLVHSALPSLAEAGLVSWSPGAETVALSDNPVYADPAIRAIIRDHSRRMDAVVRALSSARRRHVLEIVRDAGQTVDRRALARAVAARERGVPESAVSDATATDVLVSLHHVHLPRLEAAGLVAEDDAGESVAFGEPVPIVDEWFRDDQDGDALELIA